MHQTVPVRVLKRRAHLAQEVDDPLRRQRPVLPDQGIEVETVEQLHHVVEPAVLGDAEVVELHRVRGREGSGGARLTLEAHDQKLGIARHRARRLLADELDRRRPDQQPVARAPDLAHTTPTDLLLEQVLSQLTRLGDLPAEPVQDP